MSPTEQRLPRRLEHDDHASKRRHPEGPLPSLSHHPGQLIVSFTHTCISLLFNDRT